MSTSEESDAKVNPRHVSDGDYAKLLAIRTALRGFEQWSAERATEQGITARQHQLLLAIRGHAGDAAPTIQDVANYLFIQHHSAVELIDRAVRCGLVRRTTDQHDHRVVRLVVSPQGQDILEGLSGSHMLELAQLASLFEVLRDVSDAPAHDER